MRQLWLAFAHDRQIDVSGFDPTWLALREPADHRSRNQDVADALAARFALRDSVNVVDLGCGTGSNLRAMAELLPKNQSWTLVDHDPALSQPPDLLLQAGPIRRHKMLMARCR